MTCFQLLIHGLVSAARPFQFRGKTRLLNVLVPSYGIRSAHIHGYLTRLDLSEHIQRMVYFGSYERRETSIFRSYLRQGMTVVDVGANIGYFTLLAARLVGPEGRVLAIDPYHETCDQLEATLRANNISQVTLERCGVGRCSDSVLLFDPFPSNRAPSMLGEPGGRGQLVPIRTLDEIIRCAGIDTVDFLKLDVEGFEHEALIGADNLLNDGRVKAILCEFNEYWLKRAGTSANKVYETIVKKNFVEAKVRLKANSDLENRFFVLNAP